MKRGFFSSVSITPSIILRKKTPNAAVELVMQNSLAEPVCSMVYVTNRAYQNEQ